MTGAGTVIDSLWVALGIKADGDGLREVKNQVNEAKESLISAGSALKTFIAGFAVHEIAKIGSTFEQNQIQIAGFLSALGNSKDFTQGLQDAQGVIQQITKDAAILPGEAQEYIDVFKAGLPFVQAAMPGGSLADITGFTNKLTAIGKTFGLDSGLIAREFDHMLSPGKGMASLRLPLFRQLMSFMPKMANGARVTAEAFNAMSAPQRLQLLQATFVKLQPMLDASANSFDAMWGAAVSALKQMTRVATVPLFKGMKQALDAINSAFYNADGTLTEFGQGIVDAFSTGTQYLTQFMAMAGKLVMWFAQSKAGAAALKVTIGLLATSLAGLALEKTIGSLAKLFKSLTNIKNLLSGALFVAIALIAEDLYVFYSGGGSVTGLLVDKLGPALIVVKGLLVLLGAAWLAMKIQAVQALAGVAAGEAVAFWPLTLFIAAIGAAIIAGWELSKSWDKISDAVVSKLNAIIDAANMVREAFGMSDIGHLKTSQESHEADNQKAADDQAFEFKNKGLQWEKVVPVPGKAGLPRVAVHSSGMHMLGKAGLKVHSSGMQFVDDWTPGGASPRGVNVTHAPVQHNVFHIHSKEPRAVADEVSRTLARNAQTKTKL